MKKSAFIFIFIFIAIISAVSQPINTVKYDDILTEADARMEDRDYFNALDWYRQAYRENKSDDIAMSIAYSYYKMRDFVNAERYYKRVLDDDMDNIYIDDRYAYGRTLRSLEQDAKAQEQFELIEEVSTDQELIALAKNELSGMSLVSTLPTNEEVVVRFAAGDINTGSGEYSPIQYDETTIYFSSFDRNKEIVIDGKEKKYHSKIYRSTKSDKGYGKPEELDRKVNRDGFHVGNVAFSDDNRRMYYTRMMLTNDDITSSTIYYSDMGDEDWGAAEPLASVNGDWLAMHPAVGELLGTRVLFFVSDMEGGFGGDDIYYVTIGGGRIGPPVNLGETINTPFDDLSPNYHDGILYFSTEGRMGMGGLDIFQSIWDGSKWTTPENMGLNYNSRFDDYHFYFNKEGTGGYLVSNRMDEDKKKLKGSETCCYDTYEFSIKQLIIDLLVGVADEDKKPMDGGTVELADLTIFDEPRSQTLPEDYRFRFDLEGERKYSIIVSKEGYISDTIEITTYGIVEDKQIRKIVPLRKLPPPPPEYRIDTLTINEAIRFDNIYYEFDKWDILPESEKDLTIILGLLNDYKDMVIELSSHTDARGPTPFNLNLSQKRAESARQWLLKRGVAEDRIVPKGYGESVILNRCVNGVRCPDEEHRFNRRTEFKIIAGPETIEIRREIKTEYNGGKQSSIKYKKRRALLHYEFDSVPVITFETPVIELGQIAQGEKRKLVFDFENTGSVSLFIELATACKCTEIIWPKEQILPGGKGKIVAYFDSTDMEGIYNKSIDIIANTDPIVVEAKFNVEVILSD